MSAQGVILFRFVREESLILPRPSLRGPCHRVLRLIPTFEQLADVIRTESGRRGAIRPEDRIERDLGIVADDAVELLEAIQTHFGVRLTDHTGYATRFALAQGKTLFSGEGLGLPIPRALLALLGAPPERVRDPSVGALHAALMAAARDTPHKDSRC